MKQKESMWKSGCLIYGGILILVVLIGSQTDSLESIFGFLWIGGGIIGLFLLAQKGYLAQFGVFGCLMWLLVGWWAIILLIVLGPLSWGVALLLEPKSRCPHCRTIISAKASVCPNCRKPPWD